MKKVTIIFASLSVLALLGGCRKNDVPKPQPTGSRIEIMASVDGVAAKASKTGFAVNDTLGMWVVPYSNTTSNIRTELRPIGNYVDNAKYKHNGLTFVTVSDVFYPSENSKVDLYAVYPYNGTMSAEKGNTMTDPKAFPWIVKQKQLNADSVVLSDIMTAFLGGTKQGGTPALDFRHRLSQVLVKFSVPEKYKDKVVTSVTSVEVVGVRLKSTINIVDTAAIPVMSIDDALNAKVDVTAFQNTKPAAGAIQGSYVYESIVVPQTIASGSTIARITLAVTGLGNVSFDCKLMADHIYVPKKSTTINVTIGDQLAIVLGNNDVTITGWQKTTDVAGGTVKMCKMLFNVINKGSVVGIDKAKTAELTIDGKTIAGDVTYNATSSQYVIEYDQASEGIFGTKLQKIKITDGAATNPVVIVAEQTLPGDGFQIKGDPTSDSYATVIGTMIFNSASSVTILNSATKTLTDQSTANANCHVLKADQAVIFNAKVKGNGTSQTLATTSVKILWQGAQNGEPWNGGNLVLGNNKGISYDATTGFATVAANVTGNAVVGAYDAANNLIWSWHIWVSPTALADMAKPSYGAKFLLANGIGKTILDRNIGATSATGSTGYVQTGGMLYQWGRKDPFVGAATAGSAVRIYNDKGELVQYAVTTNTADNSGSTAAMTLFYSTAAGGDWTVKNDNLWASANVLGLVLPIDNKGAKAMADPCPAGYRVATGGSDGAGTWGELGINGVTVAGWTGAGTVNAGYNFATGILTGAPWYAAAGYRTQGGFTGIGTDGAVWSASVTGTNALGLQFTSAATNSNKAMVRSAACGVRCVQE